MDIPASYRSCTTQYLEHNCQVYRHQSLSPHYDHDQLEEETSTI